MNTKILPRELIKQIPSTRMLNLILCLSHDNSEMLLQHDLVKPSSLQHTNKLVTCRSPERIRIHLHISYWNDGDWFNTFKWRGEFQTFGRLFVKHIHVLDELDIRKFLAYDHSFIHQQQPTGRTFIREDPRARQADCRCSNTHVPVTWLTAPALCTEYFITKCAMRKAWGNASAADESLDAVFTLCLYIIVLGSH